MNDLRYSSRMLLKSPVTTLSLALGIGANTSIFSLMNAIVLRPMSAVSELRQLVCLGTPETGDVTGLGGLSLAIYQTIRARNTVFAGMFGFTGGGIVNLEADGARQLESGAHSHRYDVSSHCTNGL